MIELRHVTKTYRKSDGPAVNDLSLSVQNGQVHGFLGPNGAGKTTTLRMLASVLFPDGGEILVDGIDMAVQPLEAKRRLGFVPETIQIYPRISGMEWLHFVATVYGLSDALRDERITQLAERLDMSRRLSDAIGSYSHGMKQKIALMDCLIHRPKVLILDEPLQGLDPKSAKVVREMITEHALEGNSVFFSTHILEIAEKICDRVSIIRQGKLLTTLDVSEIRSAGDKDLESVFLELTEQ